MVRKHKLSIQLLFSFGLIAFCVAGAFGVRFRCRQQAIENFFWAATTGDCKALEKNLLGGMDVNIKFDDKNKDSNLNLFMERLFMRPRFFCGNRDFWPGDTALIVAVSHEDANSVKLLLEYGADLNIANYSGYSPLMIARYHKNAKIEKLLLNKK